MISHIYGRPCQTPALALDPRLRSGGAARKLRQGGAGAWHHRGLGQLSYPPTRTADGAPPVYSPSAQGRADRGGRGDRARRSEEHTSELQSLMRISYAVFCLKQKKKKINT